MKKFYLLTLLISVHSFSQSLVRIEPENFSTIYGFGGSGSFNDAEIVISGQNAMPPTGVPKLYLFNTDSSGINPNGTIDSPEVNQSFGGAIEMKDDYLFAGSIRNNTNAENGGAVYVFKKVNGNWEYLLKIQPSTQYENDYFGTNIKVHNNQLFITAFGYDENGDASINDGAVYIYNQNGDTFSLQQTLTGVSGNSGFGTLLEIENDILVTTSTNSTDDFITTFNQQSSNWELVNSTLMPNVSFEFNPELSLLHSDRVSLSNGKLYIYHLTDTENDFLGLKMVKIHDWSYASDEWSFVEDFVFQEGDYYEYKVKVGGNNMFLIPTGEYILMMERKNPVFHFVNENGSWSYVNAYSGMSSYTHDNFGHFTLIKENQVLFGNSGEYWTIPVAASNGGAYMLDVTLGINEFEVNNLVVYPNPTDGIVKIYFKNSEVASIEIYDGIGKKVFEKKANVQEFDISGLNSGIYFCKITNSDNSIKFQKIIKK